MKNPVVVDAQFIFDADGGVWTSEESFKNSIRGLLSQMGANARVIIERVDDSYAEYKFFVEKTQKPSMDEKDIPEIAK